MKLDHRVIVREEEEFVLLYNERTNSYIHFTSDCYLQNFTADRRLVSDDTELIAAIKAGGFLANETMPTRRLPDELRQGREQAEFLSWLNGCCSRKAPLSVIWSMTPRCNLRCLYCFADVNAFDFDAAELDVQQLFAIADQLIAAKVLAVTLSGGECFLHPGVWPVMARLQEHGIAVAAITNGFHLADTDLSRIAAAGVAVAVSLDGCNEATNALTRGRDVFHRSAATISKLLTRGIPTSVIVTITRHNFDQLREHVALIHRLGVRVVALQDLRPFGTREIYDQTRLTAQQEADLARVVASLIDNYSDITFNTTDLFTFDKANASGRIMHCPAGRSVGYIDFLGNFYPCTSLPSFRYGNLLRDGTITSLWSDSSGARELARLREMPLHAIGPCGSCANKSRCEGGCRGDALFYSNDLMGLPSRCPTLMRSKQ